MRRLAIVGTCLALAVLPGCGGDPGCEAVCAKNAECQAEAPPEADCVAICEELSSDQAYADAIEEQASCYEDSTCANIAAGACNPDFS